MSEDKDTKPEVNNLDVEMAFENRAWERKQVSMQVQGEEFKGLVNEGEIHWFQPHPEQKLAEEHVQAIEEEIQGKME